MEKRKLSKADKQSIRNDLRKGLTVHILAEKYKCSWHQIAGIKARMNHPESWQS